MNNFLYSGALFFAYTLIVFLNKKQFFPSIVFSIMWGIACTFTGLAVAGTWKTFDLYDLYQFPHLDKYILSFTISSLSAFCLAQFIKPRTSQRNLFSHEFIANILNKYKYIMYINLVWGIIKFAIFASTLGFNSVMDYRLGAELYMQNTSGAIGLLFRLGNYIQLLANFYLAAVGLYHGLTFIKPKEAIIVFLLFSPPQISTGGRLFILYFILYYFGAFLIGRGFSIKMDPAPLLDSIEKKFIALTFLFLLSLVSIIAMLRSDEGITSSNTGIDKFSYITEGLLCAEYCIDYYGEDYSPQDWRNTLRQQATPEYLKFRGYLQTSRINSIISCIITGLFLDWGIKNSLFIWFFLAFFTEYISLIILQRMKLCSFFLYIVLLKIMYESIISPSFALNYPFIELVFIFWIMYRYLFAPLEANEIQNVDEYEE